MTDQPQEQKQQDVALGKEAFKYNPDYHKFADFLGVSKDDKMNLEVAEKLAYLKDYTGKEDVLDALIVMRDITKSLGTSIKGRELVLKLYQYARLAKDRERIEKEISLLADESA